MSHNLQYQLTSKLNFEEGTQKRAIRHEEGYGQSNKIFSWGEYNNLKDTAKNFSSFLRDNYPNIKNVYQITTEHCDAFLKSKIVSCSKATINQYSTRLAKIGKIMDASYKTVSQHNWCVKPFQMDDVKLRNIAYSRSDYNVMMLGCNDCYSKRAIDLSGRFGLRVSEITNLRQKDINSDKMTLHIHQSKGGLSRDIPITLNDLKVLKEYAIDKQPNQRIIPVTANTINRYLHVQNDKNGFTKYIEAKTGIHAIRKMVAQELYDVIRSNGVTKADAINVVSEYLGHGSSRLDVARVYIANQW